ncbi:uncharacterized protein LOC110728221 isoform X2 [Chenopodium quinoa]|uniref:uncharacterized protein LOC110694048 isoform X2 n=1 Tax=Chenopodium quinoa TaxID=63459 RepID=UPI000B7949D9|nr:uncharacterized protein LOC110694048 isoform X2 [Chenopodium quinoa]XP_021763578.1 uncharacterized protein LOC110728221 isoform X2 [Chenopodium quinoa]
MAVELYTESPSSREMSPRISFSHDLKNSEIVPIEPLKSSLLDYDFDFCVTRKSSDQEPTLADELFANGIILPIQIKKKNIPTILKSKSFSPSSSSSSSSLYSAFLPPLPPSSVLNNGGESEKETEEKQSNNNNSGKSTFWTFKRSKSLNCGSIYKRGLCPLPLLSRSKSTGSSTSAKRSLISKEEKQCYLKNSSSSNHQKPPLKKNFDLKGWSNN